MSCRRREGNVVTRPTRADAAGRAYLDLQNLARRQGRQTQTLMVIYVLERFLARLEVSEYADRFVLKGGMLLAAWDARRATVDADFLARNLNLDEESVLRRVVEIAALPAPVEDGVEFRTDTATAHTIRDGDLYGGVRIAMDATVAGAAIKLRLDISTGDPVAPPPAVVDYPTLLTDHRHVSEIGCRTVRHPPWRADRGTCGNVIMEFGCLVMRAARRLRVCPGSSPPAHQRATIVVVMIALLFITAPLLRGLPRLYR